MGKRSEVPVKQRREAVLALLRKEEAAAAIARRHGVSEPTLYRWRDDFLAGGEAALTNVRTYATVTQGAKGEKMAEMGLLAEAGAIAFTDGTKAVADVVALVSGCMEWAAIPAHSPRPCRVRNFFERYFAGISASMPKAAIFNGCEG